MKLASVLAKLKPDEGPAESKTLPEEARFQRAATTVVAPEGFLAMIEMMREQRKYDWADETLRGIYDSVKEKQFVTEAQRAAVYNIRHASCDSCRRRRGLAEFDDYD